MRISRRISLSAHGAIESSAGLAIMLSPIVLPVGAAGLVVLVLAGAIVTGAGLGLTSTLPRVGVTPAPHDSVRAHGGLDGVLVVAGAFGALALAVAGDAPAALALAALVVVQACLGFVTSYTTAA